MGLIATPRKSKEIRRRIMAAEKMLDESLASLSLTELALPLPASSTSVGSSERLNFRVKVILRELGHQLETEVPQQELYQQQPRHLQQAASLKNQTDCHKLSEAGFSLEPSLLSYEMPDSQRMRKRVRNHPK